MFFRGTETAKDCAKKKNCSVEMDCRKVLEDFL